MPEYRAVRACYHNNRYFKPGDVMFAEKGAEVPRHFIASETFSPAAVKAAEVEDKVGRNVKVRTQKVDPTPVVKK